MKYLLYLCDYASKIDSKLKDNKEKPACLVTIREGCFREY
jgi:hypothetical protein